MMSQHGEQFLSEGERVERLLLFPEPFPDESLYSLAVRYHRLVASNSYRRTSEELFGTYSRTCGSVLPCCLGALSQRLNGHYSVRDLAEFHTLLPLYKPFLCAETYDSAIHCMQGTDGTGLKMSLGITASRLLKYSCFRYCDACVQQDYGEYGIPYWHRIHMAAGSCVCPRHDTVLRSIVFPGNTDWRRLSLPGETPGSLVLEKPTSDVFTVTKIQFWALSNSQAACRLVGNDFLKWHLTEMGFRYRDRWREQEILRFVEQRLHQGNHEQEYQPLVSDLEWIMCSLRRRGRVIQPFRYYFLCWLFGVDEDRLRNFEHRGFNPEIDNSFLVDASRRPATKNEESKVNKVIKFRKNPIDWADRDFTLSKKLIAAKSEIIAEIGKPRKITKSVLLRMVANNYSFLHTKDKFPKSLKMLDSLLETDHDYQLRKLRWAIRRYSLSGYQAISVINRYAGIRISKVSSIEMKKLFFVGRSGID